MLANIPIQSPPFRKEPSSADVVVVEIETTDGIIGYSLAAGRIVADLINHDFAPILKGENPLLTERTWERMTSGAKSKNWQSGRLLGKPPISGAELRAVSALDIALWDIKGKALGQPVHHLLGGASDRVPIYATHGAAYGNVPRYETEELAAEAVRLVESGNRFLKNTVGRKAVPDPEDDFNREKAIREAVGPDIQLAMDGNCRMSVPEATKLCKLVEPLNMAFIEEPVYGNDPVLLAELKSRTYVPIAAARRDHVSARDLLVKDAVDILQPNVNNDGGFTAALKIAGMAQAFNKPLGHGNGGGPYNAALQAGLANGVIVEYHFHAWMTWNVVLQEVPQPDDGYLNIPIKPGLGLDPKPEVIKEFKVKE